MLNAPQAIAVLEQIYQFYETWASDLKLACHKGCAACCTRNVTMTQAEGELILAGLEKDSRLEWLLARLQLEGDIGRPLITTNEWAECCLEGREVGEEDEQVLTPCPLLNRDQSCSIYPLRPFSCRCFGSTVDCATKGIADQPDILMDVNTVTMQIIEHLGRGYWWGNMLDVLSALIREENTKPSSDIHLAEAASAHLRQAKPLPGFLIMPDRQTEANPANSGIGQMKHRCSVRL